MASVPALSTAEVLTLRRTLARSGHDRKALLKAALGRPVRAPKALREWHDLLLFILAYPMDGEEHHLASLELERMAILALGMVERNEQHRYALTNSGVEGTPLQSTYTFTLVRWMLSHWPGRVALFLVEAPLDDVCELLRILVLPVEQETLEQPFKDVDELLSTLFGASRKTQLVNLVALLECLPGDDRQRELLFARMQVHVTIEEGAIGASLTNARGPMGPVFHHADGLRRGADLAAILDQALGKPIQLTSTAEQELIATARTVLALMHRETDPVTYAGAAELHDMGRGLRISLFSLDMAHRLPFDGYVGFMAFKNGVPLAYGGAWIFPGRSKVGINVFPSQRGGESALFFAQLLRLYRQRFGVDRFEAENYQLGHGNPDGLRSGAYWFYYRLGFRPMSGRHRRIAEREYGRLEKNKQHQVPMPILKELVEAGLELVVVDKGDVMIDTAMLTLAVQQHIVQRYGGDRPTAMSKAMDRLKRTLPLGPWGTWSAAERAALDLWALPLDMIPDLEQWSAADRRSLVNVVRAKGAARETTHQALLKKHGPLRRAFAELAREV